MTTAQAIINVLPVVGQAVKIFFTVIKDDDTFNEATIIETKVMYGNVNLNGNIFICSNNEPVAIACIATLSGSTYVSILYTKAIFGNTLPNNYSRLVQKIPSGVFTAGIDDELIGTERAAFAKLLDDYYSEYFNVVNQVYSSNYSTELEYEYNGTSGLLSNSVHPNKLFQLLATLLMVSLNTYSLELFVSKYIHYRTGLICPVYINDNIDAIGGYWILGVDGATELGSTTILAPADYQPVVTNIYWIIYNAGTFNGQFLREIQDLVTRISRGDIANIVSFNSIVNPVDDDFTLIGPTYLLDPRLTYGKCIQYNGDASYPLNIIGYKKNSS